MLEKGSSPQGELNLKQKIVVVAMDLLLLSELTYSIYLGQRGPEGMVIIFMRTFIPLAILTLAAAKILVNRLRGPANTIT